MKVALSVDSADPARGGAETYTYWLAGRLARDGHEVHLFAVGLPAELPTGVVGHVLRPRGITPAAKARDLVRQCAAVLPPLDFDVIHATNRTLTMDVFQPHGGTLRGTMDANLGMLSPAARRLKRLRWSLSGRRRAFLDLERRQMARAAGGETELIALSEMVRDDVVRFYGVPVERIRVIYNGVDTERFNPAACASRRDEARARYGIRQGETVALLLAHTPRLKGLYQLIVALAVARLRTPNLPLRLLVVGHFHPEPFERRARWVGLSEALAIFDATNDPLTAYAAADLYAQPTHYDPCSLTVLEAMACGLPVITSRRNGVSELITTGCEGYVLEAPRDPERLAETLTALCDTPRRGAMGRAARALAEQHSTERNYRDILAVYERVMAAKR
jgi:UDP-glucose:(heptosyl)LPS alpha-1,3-glucosyltransferase